jgi:hypothetical protein
VALPAHAGPSKKNAGLVPMTTSRITFSEEAESEVSVPPAVVICAPMTHSYGGAEAAKCRRLGHRRLVTWSLEEGLTWGPRLHCATHNTPHRQPTACPLPTKVCTSANTRTGIASYSQTNARTEVMEWRP